MPNKIYAAVLITLLGGLVTAPSFAGPENNFILRCAGCHGMDASGSMEGGIPDFRNYVASFSYTEKGREYLMHVPGVVNSSLTDREIAEVMNYAMTRWGGSSLRSDFKPFTEAEVHKLQQVVVKDVVKFRREVVEELTHQQLPVAEYPWP